MLVTTIEDVFRLRPGLRFEMFARIEYMEAFSEATARHQVVLLRGADHLVIEVDLEFVTATDAELCAGLYRDLENEVRLLHQHPRYASVELYAHIEGLEMDLRPGMYTTYLCVSRGSLRAANVAFCLRFARGNP